LHTLATLAEAWVSRRRVKIIYRSIEAEKATERTIEPYFVEPAAAGHASYVIAHCRRTRSLRIFKIERIEHAEMTPEAYDIPPDFDANVLFGSAWGIVVEEEVKTVRLRFVPELARIIEETIYHHSQALQRHRDGSVIMTLQVSTTVELLSWILGWGEKVEVLEPEQLRTEIIKTSKAMLHAYEEKQPL
jgi:predicted DNA-binding transcriptional regulator YafY